VSTDTIPQRVARGAALLDEKLPGWHERIDLDRLDLASSCDCVLGQEFADHSDAKADVDPYAVGLDKLDLWGFEAAEDGFESYSEHDDDEADADHAALTAEWKRVILARRGGGT
jgi:hypothetical protein